MVADRFERALAAERDSEEQAALVRELHWHAEPDAVFALAAAQLASRDPGRRELAWWVLGQIGIRRAPEPAQRPHRDATIALLVEHVGREQDPGALAGLVVAAGHLDAAALRPHVIALRGHPDPGVRLACASSLPSLPTVPELPPDVVTALAELAYDDDVAVRDSALFALGTGVDVGRPIGDPAARAAYEANRNHPDDDVRYEALSALALLGDAAALERALAEFGEQLRSEVRALA